MAQPAGGRSALTRLAARVNGILPRGALLLSGLTFTSYVMGLVRDRTFARTFGAGSELDVYNAAFVLPELALDVLVVAGLSSAFVPVFARLRHVDGGATQDFSRTVLTASVLIMLVTVAILFVLAPETMTFVAPGFDAQQQAQYVELFRVMCVTAVIFAASFALGEMLVVRQRFLAYGLAPVLYNVGIVAGRSCSARAWASWAWRSGPLIGALLHLAVRMADDTRTDFRYRPALDAALLGLPRVPAPGYPQGAGTAHRAADVPVLHISGVENGGRQHQRGELRAQLPERPRAHHRRGLLEWPPFPIRAAAASARRPAPLPAPAGDEPGHHQPAGRRRGRGPLPRGRLRRGALPGRRRLRCRGRGHDDAAHRRVRPVRPARGGRAAAGTGHLLDCANTILPVLASLAGLVVTVVTVWALTDGQGIVALPLGFVAGQAGRVLVLLAAVPGRVRSVGRSQAPAAW